jgi:drug/metabolite transporter (DMT)-like permease
VTDERRGVLAIAGAALLWSTGGVGIKAVVAAPLKVACYRSAVAAFALLVLFRPRPARRGVFLATAGCYAGCLTTFVVATKWTTAANAIFLQYSGVVWVLLLAPLVVDEPYRRADALAIAVALCGMALFFVDRLGPGGRAGDAVALLSGLFFAALVLLLRRDPGTTAEAAVTYGNVLTAAILAPFLLGDPWVDARSAAILVLLGTCQIAGAYVFFLRGLRHVAATHASLVGMLEPVANPIWVFLLLGESPGRFALLGGAVVLAAIAARTIAVAPGAAPPVPAPD